MDTKANVEKMLKYSSWKVDRLFHFTQRTLSVEIQAQIHKLEHEMLREHKKINMKKNKLHEHKETAQIQKAT